MVLGLLGRISLFFGIVLFSGCASINSPEKIVKNEPSWIKDASLNGTYNNAFSDCFINKNNYKTKDIKNLILMKIKRSRSLYNNVSVETVSRKNNSDFSKRSVQSSTKSYDKKYTILNKYKNKNKYCLHVNFENE